MNIVQCRGTPYEIGRQQGRVFSETAKGHAVRRQKLATMPVWFDMAAEERFYTKFSPAIWEEIAGIAEALSISMDRACFLFGNGGIPLRVGGCSAVMSPSSFGRNYDFRPQRYGARLALVQPTGSYASVGFSELLTGRLDGMNEHGLSAALHLVGGKLERGMSCVLIIRIILDQCANTEEAIALLRNIPHAKGYNYSLLDAGGQAAVVEATPKAFFARRGLSLACTNHFQSPTMRPYNAARNQTSWTRLPPLEAWAGADLSALGLFALLNDSASPAFFDNYDRGFGTLHTITTEPITKRVLIGIGGDAEALSRGYLDLNFRNWVEGGDLDNRPLEGQLGGRAAPYDWPQRKYAATGKE